MRTPPQATDIERSLIATILFEDDALNTTLERLRPNDFYDPYWRQCFEYAIELQMDMKPIDMMTVGQLLEDNGKENRLIDILEDVSPRVDYMVDVIKEKSVRRMLIKACNESINKAYDQAEKTDDVIDYAQKAMFDVQMGEGETLKDMHEIMNDLAQYVTELQSSGESVGISTGLDIDRILNGFDESKLYILGARPSMGKTALVMTIMRRVAKEKAKAGILSLETSHRSLAFRLVAQVANLEVDKMSSSRLTDEEMDKFLDACKELSGYGIYIDDKAAITSEQMRAKCRSMKQKGVGIIFVDFLQLVRSKGRSKHEEVGEVSKTLKAISKDLKIPIVALSQLSRKVEDRSNKRPTLADLRESGSIEEDADVVMFLYRPEYYGIEKYPDGETTSGVAEVIIAKNKDGKTGIKKQMFVKEYMRFENLASVDRLKSPF